MAAAPVIYPELLVDKVARLGGADATRALFEADQARGIIYRERMTHDNGTVVDVTACTLDVERAPNKSLSDVVDLNNQCIAMVEMFCNLDGEPNAWIYPMAWTTDGQAKAVSIRVNRVCM